MPLRRSIVPRAVVVISLVFLMADVGVAQTTISISPASGVSSVGQKYSAAVVAANITGLYGFSGQVVFDRALLRYDSTTIGTFLPNGYMMPPWLSSGPTYDTVRVDVIVMGSDTANGSGTLYTLHFTSLATGTCPLWLTIDPRDLRNTTIVCSGVHGEVTIGAATAVQLAVVAFLQGVSTAGADTMRTSLLDGGYLASHFAGVTIPAKAVDSVTIGIQDGLTQGTSTIVLTAPAWLLSDGTVRDFATSSQTYVQFSVPTGQYYIVLRHRNHLAVQSASSVALTAGGLTTYNFSTAMTQAYGTDPMVAVGTRFTLWAGDVTGNGQLRYNLAGNDRAPILAKIGGTNINATVSGYFKEDVNMNGIVRYNLAGNDRSIILTNIGGTSINAVRNSQVP